MPVLSHPASALSEDDSFPTETSTTQHQTELLLSKLLDEWRATDSFQEKGEPYVLVFFFLSFSFSQVTLQTDHLIGL